MTDAVTAPNPDVKIVAHNVVHLWAEPRRSSEMVSQTLMGRMVRVLQTEGDWSYVETDDTYRGWAESRWLATPLDLPMATVRMAFAQLYNFQGHQGYMGCLPIEASVYIDGEFRQVVAEIGETQKVLLPNGATRGDIACLQLRPAGLKAVDNRKSPLPVHAVFWARGFLGTPYLWGGSSPFGLDCSGLVQLCYRLAGIILRRDADIQRDDPRFVSVAQSDLQPGDLVFFGKPDKITHIGMHFEGNTFIHSAGGAGVIFSEWGDDRYSPGYVDARRLDPAHAHEPVTRPEGETE